MSKTRKDEGHPPPPPPNLPSPETMSEIAQAAAAGMDPQAAKSTVEILPPLPPPNAVVAALVAAREVLTECAGLGMLSNYWVRCRVQETAGGALEKVNHALQELELEAKADGQGVPKP